MKSRSQRKKESKQIGTWIFVIFGIVTLLCASYASFYAPNKTVYEYNVKAEQVYDNGKINESVELKELSRDEQEILYRAFKNTDEFLEGSEAFIETEQKFDTFDGWKVVEYNGVYLLVAVQGPEKYTRYSDWTGATAFIFGTVSLAISLVGLKEMVAPSPY